MDAYDSQTLATTTEMAAVAAFAHLGADGYPRLTPVTPLLLDGDPAFTLTYADSALAQEISTSPRAALAFSDSRLAYVGWSPLSATVRVEVFPDPEGELFRQELLTQEVRKFPPARSLIDSPVLQRENWWCLPRWIVRVVEAGEPQPIARRESPDHGLLACDVNGTLETQTVEVGDWESDRIRIRSLLTDATLPGSAPTALLSHDFAVPDMDPRATLLVTGELEGGRLSVKSREGDREIGARPGLLARWRAHRDYERRCRAGIKSYATPGR